MNGDRRVILVSLAEQRLELREGDQVLLSRPVSTARNGPGERQGSEGTPRGWHRIRAKIGAGRPAGAVFVGRRFTGEVYSPALAAAQPGRDWVLSRILWLCGEEPGRNRGGQVDSQRRYIYLHGCPDTAPLGVPLSHGCVRLRNADVIALFDTVTPGTRVWIGEGAMPDEPPGEGA